MAIRPLVLCQLVQNGVHQVKVRTFATAIELKNSGLKSISEMPSVSGLPFLGPIHHFIPILGGHELNMIHELSMERFKKYGPIYKEDIRLAGSSMGIDYGVWIYDADDCEKVFRSGGKTPTRGGFDSLGMYRKIRPEVYKHGGLLRLNDQDWYQFRSKVQPVLLAPKTINHYQPVITDIADEMIQLIRSSMDPMDNSIDDFTPQLYRYTLEAVALVALDTRLDCLKKYGAQQQDLVESVKEMFKLGAALDESFIWRIYGKPIGKKWAKFIEYNDKFTNMVHGFIGQAMDRMIKDGPKKLPEERSILELFLSSPKCTPEDAVVMAMDMFFAGIDTTAHSIVFTLHYLANNPEVQERAYDEIVSLMGHDGQGELDAEKIGRLSFMKACIKETARLTPVAPLLSRMSKEEIVLSDYVVPPRCFLIVNPWVMGRREDYFADPMKFRPERWLRENRGEEKIHPFIVLPFGHGPRMCIGRRIAEMEALTLLSKIVRNFKVSTDSKDLPTTTATISYPANPLKFFFQTR